MKGWVRFAMSGVLALAGPAAAQDFGCSGENGPRHWGELTPAWESCVPGAASAQQDTELATAGAAALLAGKENR
jgi:carbonic anhydrase